MKLKKYAFACDLKEDPKLIEEYENYHQEVWPVIVKSIQEGGVVNMEIFRTGNRLFMLMETSPDFSFEKKAESDLKNSTVQEWENLMWKYQQAIPMAAPGEKWVLMDKIFDLKNF